MREAKGSHGSIKERLDSAVVTASRSSSSKIFTSFKSNESGRMIGWVGGCKQPSENPDWLTAKAGSSAMKRAKSAKRLNCFFSFSFFLFS